MWLPVLIEGVFLVLITLGLMHYFGSLKTMRWYVMVTVFAGWFFVFSVVVLLPNDISGALYRACLNRTLEWNEGEPPQAECEEPISLVTEQFLYYAWEANYWTAFALSWAVGPLMQSYVLAGGFTFPQKAWQSIKENLILYGVLLTIGVVMLIYIGVQKNFDMEAIMGFVMAMANAYGLFFVICFLGYGLVDVPRRLWRYGNRERELRYLEFKAPEVKDTVDDTAVELVETIRRINTLDRKVSMQHQFRKYVDILVSKCPSDREKYGADRDSGGEVTKKELMNLNAKITEARRFKHRADVLWHQLLLEAFRLQDVLENRKSSTRMYTSDLWKKNMRTARERLLRRVEWYWHVWVVPLSSRSLAVVCGLFSLLIVWCEVTMFSEHPVLSVYNILLHTDDVHIFYNYLVVLISVGYMSVCAYSSLMKVRLFNYYYLVGNHQTDENSLLFCAAYLSRLTFPLTYNFSLMAGVDGTVFQRVLGKMELLPLFGLGFNTYFPILVSVICFLVLFDVFGRLLRLCNIQRFNFSRNMDESHVEEGREYIRRARERAVRHPDLFFSGVTELPSERPSRKTPVQSISTSLGVPESSESNLDDESIEGSSSTLMGRMSNLFSGIKDRAQGKNTGPSLGGSKDKSMQRNLLPKHHSASASSSTSSSSSGIPLRSVPQFNTSVVSLREEDDLDDILNADPLVPSYASRLRSNKPQKNFLSDM